MTLTERIKQLSPHICIECGKRLQNRQSNICNECLERILTEGD